MEKRKGFTLIELLVVIAIISFMLAILMPSLKRTRNQARTVVCQSNLKQWGTLFATNAEANQGRLFWASGIYDDDPAHIVTLEYRYLEDVKKKTKLNICPMAVKKSNRPFPDISEKIADWPFVIRHNLSSGYWWSDKTLGSAFESWSWREWSADSNSSVLYYSSYGTNPAMGILSQIDEKYAWEQTAVYTTKGQSNIPVFLDSASWSGLFIWEGQKPPATEEESINCCINRHNGGVNSLFLDWSVRKVGLKELWKLKWNPKFDTNGPWTIAGGVKPEDWPQWMRGFKDY
ncbi:MAG: type II secretion system protein [Sedimentisphaerales bacterium]|nr:type II secretion system protein [Sedimentisphaerales bacterium]